MSISNLLVSNNLNLKANSVDAKDLTKSGQSITYNDFAFVQNQNSGTSVTLNSPSDILDGSTFTVADSAFTVLGGTYNMPLDDSFNCIVKCNMSFLNTNASAIRSAGIGFQFQNANDTWNISPANLPIMWHVINPESCGFIQLMHKLDNGHGFKNVRLMIAGENSIDISYNTLIPTRLNFCTIERHYSL